MSVKRISLISFGCPKNTADSESLIRRLASEAGISYDAHPEMADVIVVNTCGFIEDAKRESIDAILEVLERRAEGQRLVVMGCLAKRYGAELKAEIPEIDAIFGVAQEDEIVDYLSAGSATVSPVEGDLTSLMFEQGKCAPSVPIKVAEGCDRKCTYCAIPSMRGSFTSRRPDEILAEAERYVRGGARELMLVAQDLTAYGAAGYGLPDLIRDIRSIDGDFWVRPMYLHPSGMTDELLGVFAQGGKVTPYVDMPLQHSEGKVLKLMGRGGAHRTLLGLIKRVRAAIPGVALRSTFIVGFPGETETEFEGLLAFIEEARLERMGVFKYSKEDGTAARLLKGQVPKRVKESRYHRAMVLQAGISLEVNQALVGTYARVLIEEAMPGGVPAIGRISTQAPEIDGLTFVRNDGGLVRGEFVDVKITRALDYDIEGEPV